jgi:hypothetical protein
MTRVLQQLAELHEARDIPNSDRVEAFYPCHITVRRWRGGLIGSVGEVCIGEPRAIHVRLVEAGPVELGTDQVGVLELGT